jgi:hypothetical protein
MILADAHWGVQPSTVLLRLLFTSVQDDALDMNEHAGCSGGCAGVYLYKCTDMAGLCGVYTVSVVQNWGTSLNQGSIQKSFVTIVCLLGFLQATNHMQS